MKLTKYSVSIKPTQAKMNLNDISLIFGMIGTVFVTYAPIRIEWIRCQTNQRGGVDVSQIKNSMIAKIKGAADKTTERFILISWSRFDSLVLIVGLCLLLTSYAIPFFFG